MKPWYRLNIDISNAVREDFNFNSLYTNSKFANKPVGTWVFSKDQLTDIVNQRWLDYMSSIGLNPTGIMLFYREPHFVAAGAHIDIRKNNTLAIYAINWVLNPADDSDMIWFSHPTEPGISAVTEANTNYTYWPMDDIKDLEIDRCCIKNIPTLVSISIPHNVIVNTVPRWVISVRFPIEEDVTDWEDAVTAFRKFII